MKHLLIISLIGLSACRPTAKKDEASSVANLGTIQQGYDNNGARPSCGPGGNFSLDSAFAALPPRLADEFRNRSMYFSQNSQLQNTCIGRARSNANSMSYEACWLHVRTAEGLLHPQIILGQNPQAVHRHLIAMATVAYAEFYIDEIISPAATQASLNRSYRMTRGEQQMHRFTLDFNLARRNLARAIVADLQAANQHALIQKYAGWYNATVDVLPESIDFQNFILAELMDSYYCSPLTVREFNAQYLIRTRGAFLPIVDMFGAPWYATSTPVNQR